MSGKKAMVSPTDKGKNQEEPCRSSGGECRNRPKKEHKESRKERKQERNGWGFSGVPGFLRRNRNTISNSLLGPGKGRRLLSPDWLGRGMRKHSGKELPQSL